MIRISSRETQNESQISPAQLEALLAFMEHERFFILRKFPDKNDQWKIQKIWSDITIVLNQIPGAVQTAEEWKTTWERIEFRTWTKFQKINENKTSRSKFSVSSPIELTQFEEKVVDLFGWKNMFGNKLQDVKLDTSESLMPKRENPNASFQSTQNSFAEAKTYKTGRAFDFANSQPSPFPSFTSTQSFTSKPGNLDDFSAFSNGFGFGNFFKSPPATVVSHQSNPGTSISEYKPTFGHDIMVKDGRSIKFRTKLHSISAMRAYLNMSLEELRLEDYLANRKGPGSLEQSAVIDNIDTHLFKYQPTWCWETINNNGRSKNVQNKIHNITAMKEYEQKSLEELRMQDYLIWHKTSLKESITGTFGPINSAGRFVNSPNNNNANSSISIFGQPFNSVDHWAGPSENNSSTLNRLTAGWNATLDAKSRSLLEFGKTTAQPTLVGFEQATTKTNSCNFKSTMQSTKVLFDRKGVDNKTKKNIRLSTSTVAQHRRHLQKPCVGNYRFIPTNISSKPTNGNIFSASCSFCNIRGAAKPSSDPFGNLFCSTIASNSDANNTKSSGLSGASAVPQEIFSKTLTPMLKIEKNYPKNVSRASSLSAATDKPTEIAFNMKSLLHDLQALYDDAEDVQRKVMDMNDKLESSDDTASIEEESTYKTSNNTAVRKVDDDKNVDGESIKTLLNSSDDISQSSKETTSFSTKGNSPSSVHEANVILQTNSQNQNTCITTDGMTNNTTNADIEFDDLNVEAETLKKLFNYSDDSCQSTKATTSLLTTDGITNNETIGNVHQNDVNKVQYDDINVEAETLKKLFKCSDDICQSAKAETSKINRPQTTSQNQSTSMTTSETVDTENIVESIDTDGLASQQTLNDINNQSFNSQIKQRAENITTVESVSLQNNLQSKDNSGEDSLSADEEIPKDMIIMQTDTNDDITKDKNDSLKPLDQHQNHTIIEQTTHKSLHSVSNQSFESKMSLCIEKTTPTPLVGDKFQNISQSQQISDENILSKIDSCGDNSDNKNDQLISSRSLSLTSANNLEKHLKDALKDGVGPLKTTTTELDNNDKKQFSGNESEMRQDDDVEASSKGMLMGWEIIEPQEGSTSALAKIDVFKGYRNSEGHSNSTGITLKRKGYYTIPSIDDLTSYLSNDGSCVVPSFEVGRVGYGKVVFDQPLDVAGLNLDEIVFFRNKEIIMYPDDDQMPRIGQGLNREAQVTLYKVWPLDRNVNEPIKDTQTLIDMGWANKLQKICEDNNNYFIEYNPETGIWIFRVKHFS